MGARVFLPGGRRADRQRAFTRPAIGRRSHALALRRQRHADLQLVDRRGLGKGAGEIGGTRYAITFAPGNFNNGQIGELEETLGLSAGAWQMRPSSRGDIEARHLDRRTSPSTELHRVHRKPPTIARRLAACDRQRGLIAGTARAQR